LSEGKLQANPSSRSPKLMYDLNSLFQDMPASRASAIFHDDGRICLLYPSSGLWVMRSISIDDVKDHFVFEGIPEDYVVLDVATSTDFTVVRFGRNQKLTFMVSHATKVVKIVRSEDKRNIRMVFFNLFSSPPFFCLNLVIPFLTICFKSSNFPFFFCLPLLVYALLYFLLLFQFATENEKLISFTEDSVLMSTMSEEEERVLHGWNHPPGIHAQFSEYALGLHSLERLRETGANKCEVVNTRGLDLEVCLDCRFINLPDRYPACSIVTFDGELKVRTMNVGCYCFGLLNKVEKWFLAHQKCDGDLTVLENGDKGLKKLGVLPTTLLHSFHHCNLVLLTKNKIIVGKIAGIVYVIVF
jgi:hypothetical protein